MDIEKTKERKTHAYGNTIVQRWVVDRLDYESDFARVEIALLSEEFDSERFLKSLTKKIPQSEKLSWWNLNEISTKTLSIGRLRKQLSLQKSAPLSGNMVFWVVTKSKPRKIIRVYHATAAARELAKTLYKSVAERA